MKTLSKIPVLLMLFLTVLGALTCFSYEAEAKTKKKKTVQHKESPRPANAYILIDADTGMVISQDDADRTLYPASLTKLMTLLLTFEALDNGKINRQSRVVMSSHAASMPPSKLGIRPGQSITVDQAIKILVTKSANDVAVAVGETLGGSEGRFAQMMNLKARELGMVQTHFVNASGLHNVRQTSSPRDMAKLGLYILKNYPNYYAVFSTREVYFNGKAMRNHNHLMESYRGMDGMKTGYIGPSGFNLVASAKRGNVRLIGVVFGGRTADSRNKQMAGLLDDGFSRVQQLRLMKPQMADNSLAGKGRILATQPTKKIQASPLSPVLTPPRKPDNMAALTVTSAVPAPHPSSQILATPTGSQMASRSAATQPLLRSSTPILTTRIGATVPPAVLSAPPAPSAQQAGGEGWSVQIGAFQDRLSTDQAIYRAIQKLPAPLNRGNAMIVPLRTVDATWMFRARIGGYTKEQALQACRYLDDCLTISPSAN